MARTPFADKVPPDPKGRARLLPYLVREVPGAAGTRRWIAWTPKLPNPHRHAFGSTPLRALFAAHGAARAGLAARPDLRPDEPDRQRAYRRRPFRDDHALLTGRRAGDPDGHPELAAFAVLGAQQLDAKDVAHVVARHPLPPRTNAWVARYLDATFSTAHQTLLAYAAEDPDLPEEALHALADKGFGAAVLRHPAVPRRLVERLARDEALWPHAAGHPLLRLERLRAIYAAVGPTATGPRKETLKAIARHPRCPPDVVAQLAGHPDPFVREQVALRGDLPRDVRDRLADDDLERVRAALTGRRKRPKRRGDGRR